MLLSHESRQELARMVELAIWCDQASREIMSGRKVPDSLTDEYHRKQDEYLRLRNKWIGQVK